jgi:hypothetical protein
MNIYEYLGIFRNMQEALEACRSSGEVPFRFCHRINNYRSFLNVSFAPIDRIRRSSICALARIPPCESSLLALYVAMLGIQIGQPVEYTTAVRARHLDSKKRSVFLWVYFPHVSDESDSRINV